MLLVPSPAIDVLRILGADLDYSWHATQEHRWFNQGRLSIIAIFVILMIRVLFLLRSRNNPGARSSIDVLLDAFCLYESPTDSICHFGSKSPVS